MRATVLRREKRLAIIAAALYTVVVAAMGVSRLSLLLLVKRDMAHRRCCREPSTGEGSGAGDGEKAYLPHSRQA